MRIIIEEHQYPAEVVKDVLDGITTLRDIEGKVSVNYVGYYYNPTLKDTVFILPKVLLGKMLDEDGNEIKETIPEFVFGKYKPEDIINLDSKSAKELLTQEEHDFIYELSVWIYRTIVVFRDSKKDTSIVLQQNVQQMSKGRLQKAHTFLDIILALQKFNRENQDFFFFILRNIHSGMNKINWTRTINKSQAFIQNGTPIYIDIVNQKRQVNIDEELLIIYFSILNYIHEAYGFPVTINVNFPLITSSMFRNYMKGMGKVRLLQIKYKYFSDKALYLWELCYAFFDRSKNINVETDDKEYLLVKNFNIVFEAIIDHLLSDQELKKGELADQPDGKQVDHIYQWKDLTDKDESDTKAVYYIGDSKYYKRNHEIGKESVYKQFTYARNVIQWNLNLFNDGSEGEQSGHKKLRDEVTEGYNIVPNFFISAEQKTLKATDDIKLTDNQRSLFESRQFDNRLFDRDTLLVNHYDVNFLFVVALYGRNKKGEQHAWQEKVKDLFRTHIRKTLEDKYDFYALKPHDDAKSEAFIKEHFKELNGKMLRPYEDRNMYTLALEKIDKARGTQSSNVYSMLQDFFEIEPINLGEYPKELLDSRVASYRSAHPEEFASEEEAMNVLIGVITDNDDKDLAFFLKKGRKYCMRNIPRGNFLQVKHFAPMIKSSIAGYYEIESMTIGERGGKPCLNLTLKDNSYISLGDNAARIPFRPHSDLYSIDFLKTLYAGDYTIV